MNSHKFSLELQQALHQAAPDQKFRVVLQLAPDFYRPEPKPEAGQIIIHRPDKDEKEQHQENHHQHQCLCNFALQHGVRLEAGIGQQMVIATGTAEQLRQLAAHPHILHIEKAVVPTVFSAPRPS